MEKSRKGKRLKGAAIVLAVLLIAAFALAVRRHGSIISLVQSTESDPFVVESVCVGMKEEDVTESADVEAIRALLLEAKGEAAVFPNGGSSMALQKDMIQIHGRDAKGAVHFVLYPSDTDSFMYRNGVTHRNYLQDAQALYQAVQALIE